MSKKLKKVFKWLAGILFILVLIPVAFFLYVYYGNFGALYSIEDLRNIQNYQGSEVYSADKKIIGKFYWENRNNITAKELPPFLTESLIATEDARFYEHKGVDYKSLLRVFFKTLLLGEKSSGGGSTISQQLAKNLFKRENHGIFSMPVNKIKEAIYAVRFNKVYSQEEVLLLYLNTVSFGEDTYGIKNASQRFFSKSPDSLRIEEISVLIGMLKSPTSYNPRLHPDKSLERRNVVINNLFLRHYLFEKQADSLKKIPLIINYKNSGIYGEVAPYFLRHVELLTKSILDTLTYKGAKYNLYTSGLKIYTTLDFQMQIYGLEAVKKHMRYLQGLMDKQWYKSRKSYNKLISFELRKNPRYKKMLNENNSIEISKSLKRKANMEVFDWGGGHIRNFSLRDSISYYLKQLQTAVLAMEPSSGQVKVWIGGDDYHFFQYDHVKAQRQVGSTFKPIVYATALEQGLQPCDYIKNERKVYPQFENWSPENADGVYGGKYSVKGALANSVNVVSVEVLLKAGIGNTIATARKLGIRSDLPYKPSIALGVAGISLLEMVRAYTVFPNYGRVVEPVFITRIEDSRGNIIYNNDKIKSKQVLSRQTSYFITEMLNSVMIEGTGKRIKNYNIKGELAGKTGTTQSGTDGWFIGFTPNLVTGVWVGADNPAVHFISSEFAQGAFMALPIWADFYKRNQMSIHYRKYLKGNFYASDLIPLPGCESFKKENFLDKLKNFFRRKTPEEKQLLKQQRKEKKKKRFWLF